MDINVLKIQIYLFLKLVLIVLQLLIFVDQIVIYVCIEI